LGRPNKPDNQDSEQSGEYAVFASLLHDVLSVPKSELDKREEQYQEKKVSMEKCGHNQAFLSTGWSVKK
jgi:hypothetical protein